MDELEQATPQPRPRKRRRRRRRYSLRSIVMMLALAALVILIVVLVARCAARPKDTIVAKAFSSQAELALPLEAELNSADLLTYGGHRFETGKKLSALTKLITKYDETVSAATYENAYGPCVLFQKQTDVGVDSWCLYQQDPANTKNCYVFMGAHREIQLENTVLDLLLPVHLIADSAIRDSMGSRLQLDKTYYCGCKSLPEDQTIASAFRVFYEQSGLYTVTPISETSFSVLPRGGVTELTFNFSEDQNEGKFLITIPLPEIPEPTAVASISAWVASAGAYSEPVNLPEQDALALSELLINKDYKGASFETPPVYEIDLDGEFYYLDCVWDADTWKVTAYHGGKKAVLTAKGSCTIAAIIAVNNVPGTPAREVEGSESWLDMATCMVTTTDVNVRSAPVDGKVLMTMPNGSAVAVVGNTGSGWYEILYNGQRAYMSSDYLRVAGS